MAYREGMRGIMWNFVDKSEMESESAGADRSKTQKTIVNRRILARIDVDRRVSLSLYWHRAIALKRPRLVFVQPLSLLGERAYVGKAGRERQGTSACRACGCWEPMS